jgi:LysM repeat protein
MFHFYENIIFIAHKTVDMSETRVLHVIALIIALIVPSIASAQVPVKVSNEKIISGGKVYYMHEVQKGQTLYSICLAYKVTIDAITRENVIPSGGIQAGQVLRIPSAEPVPANQTRQPEENQAATRTASQTATRTVSRTVSQAATTEPGSEVSGGGIEISKEKIVSSGKVYFMHEVQKGQTLYSIAKAYQVTILDIDRENTIPAGGIRVGQVLRILASSSLVSEVMVESPPAKVEADRPAAAATEATPQPSHTQTQMPHQESTHQTSQLPHQEQAAAGTETIRTSETQAAGEMQAQAQEAPVTRPVPEAKTQTAEKQKPATKQAQPARKKIHKVQKGESLADIAKKYNITVQELKQANKGVIFAMPDMRLVIPASGGSDKQY